MLASRQVRSAAQNAIGLMRRLYRSNYTVVPTATAPPYRPYLRLCTCLYCIATPAICCTAVLLSAVLYYRSFISIPPSLLSHEQRPAVTEAINVLLQQHSASRNLFAAAAAAAAANPAGAQAPNNVPGLAAAAAALQQFHNRGGADLSGVGGVGSGGGELTQGVRPIGHHHASSHHTQHAGHHHHQHPHHSQHPSQHQQQQDAAAAAAEAAAQQLAAAAGVGAFDLSSLTGQGMGFW